MINGHKERKITSYLPIDHCAEGFTFVSPEDDEEFVGIPHSSYNDISPPFIEVRVKGEVVRTVNVFDLSEVVFEVAKPGEKNDHTRTPDFV